MTPEQFVHIAVPIFVIGTVFLSFVFVYLIYVDEKSYKKVKNGTSADRSGHSNYTYSRTSPGSSASTGASASANAGGSASGASSGLTLTNLINSQIYNPPGGASLQHPQSHGIVLPANNTNYLSITYNPTSNLLDSYEEKPLEELPMSIEPFVGYRLWGVTAKGSLLSMGVGRFRPGLLWPYRKRYEASCLAIRGGLGLGLGRSELATFHNAPHRGCRCGVNISLSENYISDLVHTQYDQSIRSLPLVSGENITLPVQITKFLAIGSVHGWGHSHICNSVGARTQYGYPKNLVLLSGIEFGSDVPILFSNSALNFVKMRDKLMENYGVPVEIMNDLEELPLFKRTKVPGYTINAYDVARAGFEALKRMEEACES